MVYAIGNETGRPTYVVYYHVIYAIDSELLDPRMSCITTWSMPLVVKLLDPRMSFITTWSMSLVVDLNPRMSFITTWSMSLIVNC